MFSDLKAFVMFIGHSRSGSTLMGSLLDAHRNAIISREAHVLNLVKHGWKGEKIFRKLMRNSSMMATNKTKWNGYKYVVPNQYPGTFKDQLLIIGDKKANKSVKLLRLDPDLIDKLEQAVELPVKIIHVIRNPYDNITTTKRGGGGNLKYHINDYFELCADIAKLRKRYKDKIFEYKHEEFIDTSKLYLTKLCHFLGLKVYRNYLADCKSIIFKSPHQTRNKINWNEKSKIVVQKNINDYNFLKGYKF